MQTEGPGALLGSGRSADVFAMDDDWVLRRYRDGGDATAEAVVMTYLAGHGYPVPRVRDAGSAGRGPAPRTDLVMRRLGGETMLRALTRAAVTADEAGATLADLLTRLHRVPARVSTDPAHRVLHLDLHPDNVMLTEDGPVVIDWCNTREGPPGLDWAMSALILAQVAVAAVPGAAMARAVLTALLAHLGPEVDLGTAAHGCLAGARTRRAADRATAEYGGPHLLDDAAELVLRLRPV